MLQVQQTMPKVALLYLIRIKVLYGHGTLPVLCGSLAEMRDHMQICANADVLQTGTIMYHVI